ncbi:unnamed protein product [Caenorhabditis bovis]|uniref:Ku domain-containing protein n=1 Tax=Caenorhabditis bovis TaxID=2654633 RepID=A0A8S1ELW7_9PELO|nr:unnamed protein product [Caenorhabditis bovis]
MEESSVVEDFAENINKKYTFFVVDGSEAMFESTKDAECDFRTALKLILDELINICCLPTLNNQIGIIFTNTANSNTKKMNGVENAYVLFAMCIPNQEIVNEIRELCEKDDLKSAFLELSNGFTTCDLASVFTYCKRVFSGFSNTRHQSVIYFTNNRNPFERNDFWESSYYNRTKASVSKIIGQGQRKTLGEFSVVLLPQNCYKPENRDELRKEPWYLLDAEVFSTTVDVHRRIRQKTSAIRSHANVSLNIGAGVSFCVGVFALAAEARPLPRTREYLKTTEQPIEKKTVYVSVDEEFSEIDSDDGDEPVFERAELKKVCNIGGERIELSRNEHESMRNFEEKGITLIGFRPIHTIDTELSICPPKFIRPDEQNTIGGTRMYRALLDRCHARQQAMICRYQTRANEKLRLVALIPWKWQPIEMADGKPMKVKHLDSIRSLADASEYIQEGFYVFFLPFREKVRDDSARLQEGPTNGEWPVASASDVGIAGNFISRLKMSYNPGFYENPRLLSEKSALAERATGEMVLQRRDTLAPYHTFPERLARVQESIEAIVGNFSLTEVDEKKTKKRKNEMTEICAKKGKNMEENAMELYKNGNLAKLTKVQLEEAIKHFGSDFKKNAKKAELIEILTEILEKNL